MQVIRSGYERIYNRWLARIRKSGIKEALDYKMKTPWHRLAFRLLSSFRIKGNKMLVVGCGIGSFSAALALRGAIVTSLDLARGAVNITKKMADAFGVEIDIVEGDAQNLPCPSGFFDFVLSLETLEHIPDFTKALAEMFRCVKSNGYLLLTFPNVLSPIGFYLRIVSRQPFERSLSPFLLKREIRRTGSVKFIDVQGAYYFLGKVEQQFPKIWGSHIGYLMRKL